MAKRIGRTLAQQAQRLTVTHLILDGMTYEESGKQISRSFSRANQLFNETMRETIDVMKIDSRQMRPSLYAAREDAAFWHAAINSADTIWQADYQVALVQRQLKKEKKLSKLIGG